MTRPWLQRLMGILLVLLTLGAMTHHGLCAAGIIECVPCQSADSGEDDNCPHCAASLTMITEGVLKAKQACWAALPLFPAFEWVRMILVKPPSEKPVVVSTCEDVCARHEHLRDLRRGIPIRAPSLTA